MLVANQIVWIQSTNLSFLQYMSAEFSVHFLSLHDIASAVLLAAFPKLWELWAPANRCGP